MGYGSYSGDVYYTTTSKSAFNYSAAAHATGRYDVHPTLNPFGLTTRESRDNPDHPVSRAIMVHLDGTGSNIQQARIVHEALPTLMGLILRKGFTADPQIATVVIGDATCDRVPLQVSQFESDNRIDEALGNMILEGGGGGQMTESYELGLYVAARKTAIDCFEKRGDKGIMVMVGDEMAYPKVSRDQLARLIGDQPEVDIPLDQIVSEALETWDITFMVPAHSAHGRDSRIPDFWRQYFGQSVVVVEDSKDIVPMIAALVLSAEGLSVDSILNDLSSTGVDSRSLAIAGEYIARRPSVARVSGPLSLSAASSGSDRL